MKLCPRHETPQPCEGCREEYRSRNYEKRNGLATLNEISAALGLTRRQVELSLASGLAKIRAYLAEKPALLAAMTANAETLERARQGKILWYGENE